MSAEVSQSNAYVTRWTAPWHYLPREAPISEKVKQQAPFWFQWLRRKLPSCISRHMGETPRALARQVIAIVQRVVEGCLLGPVPFLCSVFIRLAPKRVSAIALRYFTTPYEFLPQKQSLMQQTLLITSTLGPAIAIAGLSNCWFRPLISLPFSFFARYVRIVRWVEDHTLLSVPLSLSTALVYFSASSIRDDGDLVRLPGRVGPFADFYSKVMHEGSTTLCIGVQRNFVVLYPALVVMNLANDYREYFRKGHHISSGIKEVKTEVLFHGEQGEGVGVVRECFLVLMQSLLERDGAYSALLELSEFRIQEKGVTTTIKNFYQSLGVIFAAISMLEISFGFGLLIDGRLLDAIREVRIEDLDAWDGKLLAHQALLVRISKVLNRGDTQIQKCLDEGDFEFIKPLLLVAARVLYICQGIRVGYADRRDEWEGIVTSGFLRSKLIGDVSLSGIVFEIVEPSDKISQQVGWIENWLKVASNEDRVKFLLFISASPVLSFRSYQVYASTIDSTVLREKDAWVIAARTCTGSFSLRADERKGMNDTKENFLKYFTATIFRDAAGEQFSAK